MFVKRLHKLMFGVMAIAACTMSISVLAAGRLVLDAPVFFGDSLVDVGNDLTLTYLIEPSPEMGLVPGFAIPPLGRYDRGRFANGPTFPDLLALRLNRLVKASENGFRAGEAVSFGYGGSTTGETNLNPGGFIVLGLKGQVSKYLTFLGQERGIEKNAPMVIWSGANDYLLGVLGIVPITDPAEVVGNIAESIEQLFAKGARLFLVLNLPDLGEIPICQPIDLCAPLTQLTEAHNSLLKDTLASLESSLQGSSIRIVDAYSITKKIVEQPEQYGFNPDALIPGPGAGCLFQDVSSGFDPALCNPVSFATNYLFWDEEHPSTAMHAIYAQAAWYMLGAY